MSDGFVADASVGVAWAVHSQASTATDDRLDQVATGISLIVPTLWTREVAHSLLALMRRGKILAEDRDRALAALSQLPLMIDDEGPHRAFGMISKVAAEHGLSVYDAAYLELAVRRDVPLASRDQALCKAAHQCGVRLLT